MMSELTITTLTQGNNTPEEFADSLKPVHALFAAEHPIEEMRDWETWSNAETIRDNMTYHLAHQDGTLVGFCSSQVVAPERQLAHIDIWVATEVRRQGIGRALFDHLRAALPEFSFTAVTATGDTEAADESHPGTEFAAALGWHSYHSQTYCGLTGQLDKKLVQEHRKAAIAKNPELTVKTYAGELPEDLKAQVAVTNMFLDDPELQETQELDAEFIEACLAEFDDLLDSSVADGVTPLVTTVRDADDALVAFAFDEIPDDADADLDFGVLQALGPVPDATQSLVALSLLRSVAVLFPGFTSYQAYLSGENLGTLTLLATLKKVGFTVTNRLQYFEWSYLNTVLAEGLAGTQTQAND